MLEFVFVLVTLAECEQICSGWEMLDESIWWGVRESFQVLQNCLHPVRGRFRQAFRRAFEARSEAVRSRDVVGEARGWKLSCFVACVVVEAEHRQSQSAQSRLVLEVRFVHCWCMG